MKKLLLSLLLSGATALAQTVVIGPLTNSELRSSPVNTRTTFTVPQHVVVDNYGQFGGGSTGLTDAQLRATPVPVSGSLTVGGTITISNASIAVTQGGSWATSVSNFPATQPVSGTFWQATQPVSLASVPIHGVTGTFWQATQPVSIASMPTTPVTGTFFQATQPVSLATNTPDVTDRVGRLLGHVTVDNSSIAVTGAFFQATQPVSLATNTPDVTDRSARLLGHVTIDNSSLAVTGTFFQATQPVSQSGSWTVGLPSGASTESSLVTRLAEATFTTRIPVNGQALMAASIPVVLSSNQSSIPVTGTFFQATQPVSLATAPTTPVTGTFWQATQPVSGTVTVTDGAGALNTIIDSGTVTTVSTVTNLSQLGGTAISMNTGVRDAGTQRVTIATNDSVPVTGTFFQATQPISAASLPLPASAAQEHVTTGSPHAVRITDGTNFLGTSANPLFIDDATALAVTGTFFQATQPVVGAAASGAAKAGNPVQIGGVFNTTQPTVTTGQAVEAQSTSHGSQIVTLYDAAGRETSPQSKRTYSASSTFTPVATPTDLVIIEGSATTTVRVISFVISTTNTAAGSQQFFLVKRSAADTTGTFVAATAVPYDSANAAATVNRVGHFTANPGALGAAVGTIRTKRVASPVAVPATWAGITSDASVEMLRITDSNSLDQVVTLRGVAQTLALNFNGVALVAGQTHAYTIVWTEE